MDKKFTFEQKETYTLEDVQGILKGHKGYLKVDEINETNKKLSEQLEPYLKADNDKKIKSLIPETANMDLADDIISLSGITKDDDDEAIKNKLMKTIDSRDYLKKATVAAPEAVEEKKDKSVKKTEDKEYRFMK